MKACEIGICSFFKISVFTEIFSLKHYSKCLKYSKISLNAFYHHKQISLRDILRQIKQKLISKNSICLKWYSKLAASKLNGCLWNLAQVIICSSGHILPILLKIEFLPLICMEPYSPPSLKSKDITKREDIACLMFLCHVRK